MLIRKNLPLFKTFFNLKTAVASAKLERTGDICTKQINYLFMLKLCIFFYDFTSKHTPHIQKLSWTLNFSKCIANCKLITFVGVCQMLQILVGIWNITHYSNSFLISYDMFLTSDFSAISWLLHGWLNYQFV